MVETPLPAVSVIMPVRNEAGFIRQSVGAVLAQRYPADLLEVIVADGQSNDGTRELLDGIAQTDPRLRVLENAGRIVATGLNQALAVARGTVIVRVDGHCEIEPDYVRNAVMHLLRGEAEGVGGPLLTVGDTRVARAIAAAMSSSFGVGNSAFRTVKDETKLVDTVAFPAYTRALIDRAGGFDTELVRNQDDEYNYRLRKLGARLLLATDVRSRYYSRGSFRKLWRQYFQYGYWKVRVLQKHPGQMSLRQFVPPAFVVGLLGLVLLTGAIGPLPLVLLAATYGSVSLLAAWRTAREDGDSSLLFPIALGFVILHVSYGSGFLVGLLKFWNRWGAETRPMTASVPGQPLGSPPSSKAVVAAGDRL